MNCLICGEENHNYLYMLHGIKIWQCAECGFISSHLHSSDDDGSWSNEHYNDSSKKWMKGKTQTEASKRYLEVLKFRDPSVSRIILVSHPNYIFPAIAQKKGLQVIQHFTVEDFEQKAIEDFVDAVIFLYQLEKSNSPQSVLNKAYDLLKPGGTLLVIIPSLDSRSAQFFGNAWTEWRPENKYYFDDTTIQSLLWKCGFNEIRLDEDFKMVYTIPYK